MHLQNMPQRETKKYIYKTLGSSSAHDSIDGADHSCLHLPCTDYRAPLQEDGGHQCDYHHSLFSVGWFVDLAEH